jgi:glyoxylase-like metal-dependent hydrolase (beta-lactamase superfamily II)/poly(3-hydroxybutyrate) depolymerase
MKSRLYFSTICGLVSALILLSGCSDRSESQGTSAEASKMEPMFQSAEFTNGEGTPMPYRYFVPAGAESGGDLIPLILYLHGEGEAGSDNKKQVTITECATIWIEPDHLAANPAYVLAPQIPAGADWTEEPYYSNTLALLNNFVEGHSTVDGNRLYLVGFSSGATGVWSMVLKNPDLFAAAMPISGNADIFLAEYAKWEALKNFPFYVIHSYDDPVSPVSGSINALAALKAAGNLYSSSSASACLWSAESTPSPHDAWWTAFHKFEVVYNSLFWHSREGTKNGEISPTTLYSKKDLGDGITMLWDYALSTSFVIERPGKAIIVDAMMGHGNLYDYIKENVLVNKDVDIEFFLSHNDNDHVYGLRYFLDVPQLKRVYMHEADKDPVVKLLGKDADKLKYVTDGDTIKLGAENADVILVPGHSRGSIILRYGKYLFSGDAIGTGYIGCGEISFEEYITSVEHLLAKMGNANYTILAGHTGECRKPMTETYVHDLLSCAKGLVNGSIPMVVYWRNAGARRVATYGDASITGDINNKRRINGALFNLSISEGTITPSFARWLVYYNATVDENVNSFEITSEVLENDYKKLTVNGTTAVSKEPFKVNLEKGLNRFVISVTSAEGVEKTYTLTVKRGS